MLKEQMIMYSQRTGRKSGVGVAGNISFIFYISMYHLGLKYIS